MPDKDRIRELITTNERRLHKLEEQKAVLGINTEDNCGLNSC